MSKFREERLRYKNAVLFYASSAGEYEQARPLAQKLKQSDVYVHLMFFSESGYNFASLRSEEIPYSLAPLDSLENWEKIFKALNPKIVVVVRHEFWPCFLYVSRKYARVYLINASLKSTHSRSLFFKGVLLRFFDKVFTVSEMEKDNFLNFFPDLTDVQSIGDSKYDRVLERVEEFHKHPKLFPVLSKSKRKLIVGSAWHQDCELVLKAFSEVKIPNLQLLIVPHQPSPEFISWLTELARSRGLSYSYFSSGKNTDPDLVIVDAVGLLFDLYGSCDLAFIGGALHHEVHNVLEAAAFALPLAFGPRFKNSHEATEIVSKNLARVLQSSEECKEWITSKIIENSRDKELEAFVKSKAGAGDCLLREILASKTD